MGLTIKKEITLKTDAILNEIKQVLDSFDPKQIADFVNLITADCLRRKKPRKVLCYGAGRMGLGARAFAMRLNHLGFPAYYFGDTYIPPFGKDDIVVAVSNSGETQTVVSVVEAAVKKAGCQIVAITGNPNSTLAKLSTHPVIFKSCNGGLNSADDPSKINSIQPMTTLTEQALFVFFDACILEIIEEAYIDLRGTAHLHSNIE